MSNLKYQYKVKQNNYNLSFD